MARTDRDDARWFWKDHFDWRKRECVDYCTFRKERCWCRALPDAYKWVNPYRYEYGVPSYWNRDERRRERAYVRNLMDRARRGRIDWDDLSIGYRRPYYW